jgi:hypothetical protein
MSLDAEVILCAQRLLQKGYSFQNASRIANVSEADLRAFVGAVRVQTVPRACPSPWLGADVIRIETPRAQPASELCGPSRTIVREVAQKYFMTVADIVGGERTRPFAFARHEAMYRIKTERKLSLPDIGRRLGGRDHTTVLHGIRCHEARMAWADVLTVFADIRQPDLFARAA